MATEIYLGYPSDNIVEWIRNHLQPAAHEETWYKYSSDTEWRTTMLSGEIALVDDTGEPTGQIKNPFDIVAIEIGTGTQANPVTSIGDQAFYDCGELTDVTIPDSVTSIGDGAFVNCSGLTSVTISNSVMSIGASTFYNCSGLMTVTIPNSVTSIGVMAFYECTNLTNMTIGSGIQRIGSGIFATYVNPVTLTINKTVAEVQAMGTTDYDPSTNVPYSEWGLPSGSTIVCIGGTITV